MHKQKHILIALLMLALLPLGLYGCGTSSDTQPLTPLPHTKVDDPTDEALKEALHKFLSTSEAPVASTYKYVRFDLNGDHRRDALVLFKTPYGYWCGINGCTMLVLKAHDKHFTLVNAIQPVREPVYIGMMKTKGWNDILVRVSGRAAKAKDVTIKFDGNTYHSDPSKLPASPRKDYNGFTKAFW